MGSIPSREYNWRQPTKHWRTPDSHWTVCEARGRQCTWRRSAATMTVMPTEIPKIWQSTISRVVEKQSYLEGFHIRLTYEDHAFLWIRAAPAAWLASILRV